jgi:TDG/mug DNA glycosylase family protein
VRPQTTAPTAPTARRPSRADLESARSRTIADVAAPGLSVLFSGINPGLYSAWTGHHFARPGNRFWPALHASGFTPRLLRPAEQHELLGWGLGITNVAPRATARAEELTREEIAEGGRALTATVRRLRPAWLAVLGVTAYRTAFALPRAAVGRQDATIGATRVWVLPNPSGLNAHYSAAALAEQFSALREAAQTAAPAAPLEGTPRASAPLSDLHQQPGQRR